MGPAAPAPPRWGKGQLPTFLPRKGYSSYAASSSPARASCVRYVGPPPRSAE